MTLDLLSIGFAFVVHVDGLVIDMNIDEDEGVIQIDGSSIPQLDFDTPAGPGTLFFVPRLVEGTIDRDTGEILIEDLYIGLEFLGTVLPVGLNLSTGTEVLDEFSVTGELLDEVTGEVILVGVGLAPAGPLSPPIAIALIIEGVLRGD